MADLVLLRGDERPRRGVFERESMHCSRALAMYFFSGACTPPALSLLPCLHR